MSGLRQTAIVVCAATSLCCAAAPRTVAEEGASGACKGNVDLPVSAKPAFEPESVI
ncbi:hypothetical protein [Mycobacterium simiae]|uniref:hypothetical protein n=1 Tax=Mycobacterium simiae TaxID=1784 RepID=UPI00165EEDB2|nr:hypothetical protein [Mycobacterium simiae]